VRERDSILAEIHRLIDKQMEALKARLSPDDVVEYAERTKRIRMLLETIGRNHERA